jgi:C-terminal processing protease CtpA/Prc
MRRWRKTSGFICVGVLLAVTALAQTPAPVTPELLGFEMAPADDRPGGWNGFPAGTVFADAQDKHGGKQSLRLERTKDSAGQFSTVIASMPIDFKGATVELRGWLKREGAGVPSLWLRQDNAGGSVAFVDMSAAPDVGESWSIHSIVFPLKDNATALVFGVRLMGDGKSWADDLQLFVDGKPIAEVARQARAPSVLEQDQQFNAGSGLELGTLDAAQIDALVLTGKVWGFLKYHHPLITSGKKHWDFELLRRLPAILGAKRQDDVRRLLTDWIDSLGPLEPCKTCAALEPKDLQLSPHVDWIRDRQWLGEALSRRLQAVFRNRVPYRQFFVSLAPNVGNPVFENEPGYPATKFPDAGFQILAIFRFWNIVEYWAPYRNLIDEDWDAVLKDTLARAAQPLDAAAFQRELMRLVARADDGHANVNDQPPVREPRGDCQLPVSLRYREGQFVVNALLADDAGASLFHPGDVVKTLDDEPLADLVKRIRDLYGASNEWSRMNVIARSLTRGACGPVSVRVQRDAELKLAAQRVDMKSLRLERVARADRAGETFQMLTPQVAYLKLSSIKAADVNGYIATAAGAKALIVDIRNYPSEYVVYALGNLLVDETAPFVVFTKADLTNPGAFHFGPRISLTPAEPHFGGRVMILVDENSISQAEYTAMALRASPRARIVGTRTAGADGDVSPIDLPGGFRTRISGIGVFYPDRRPTQQVGVKLDVECPSTIAGLREGRDETLDCALRELAKDP